MAKNRTVTAEGVSGLVLTAGGGFPMWVGVTEATTSHTHLWANGWVKLAAVLWVVALVLLAGSWGRVAVLAWRKRGGQGPVLEVKGEPRSLSRRQFRRLVTHAGEKELKRQRALIRRLHAEYLLKFPDASPEIRVGTEPLPADWVERRLTEMGEPWRYTEYLPD